MDERGVVVVGALELGVVGIGAVLAGEDLELVGDVPALVPEEAVVLVVALALLQAGDEPVVGKTVVDAVARGDYLVAGQFLGDELEADQKGVLLLEDGQLVHDLPVEAAADLLSCVANRALLEDLQVKEVLQGHDDLFGVCDAYLNLLAKTVDGLPRKMTEEVDTLEDGLICLVEVILLVYLGQTLDELLLVLNVELLFDLTRLFDIITDF